MTIFSLPWIRTQHVCMPVRNTNHSNKPHYLIPRTYNMGYNLSIQLTFSLLKSFQSNTWKQPLGVKMGLTGMVLKMVRSLNTFALTFSVLHEISLCPRLTETRNQNRLMQWLSINVVLIYSRLRSSPLLANLYDMGMTLQCWGDLWGYAFCPRNLNPFKMIPNRGFLHSKFVIGFL